MFSEKLTDVIGKIQKAAGPDFTIIFGTVNGKDIFDVRLEPIGKATNKEIKPKLIKISKIINDANFTPIETKLPKIIPLCSGEIQIMINNFGFRNTLITYFDLGECIARRIKECKIEIEVGNLAVVLEDELDVEMTLEGITGFLQYLGGGKVEPDEITNFLDLAGY